MSRACAPGDWEALVLFLVIAENCGGGTLVKTFDAVNDGNAGPVDAIAPRRLKTDGLSVEPKPEPGVDVDVGCCGVTGNKG
jgi:hypothetical protein